MSSTILSIALEYLSNILLIDVYNEDFVNSSKFSTFTEYHITDKFQMYFNNLDI